MRNAEALLLAYAANALWMTCALAALAAALTRVLRRASAAQTHVVWATALVLSMLLPLAAWRPIPSAPTTPATSMSLSPGAAPAILPAAAPTSLAITPFIAAALIAFTLIRAARLARAWMALVPMLRAPLIRYADVAAPFTAGIRRSVIVLPRWLATRPTERRAVLAHEIAHIRRHDFLFNVIYEVVLIPLAWHPAALWIKSQIDQTRELACDEIAARAPRAYARTLLDIAQNVWAAEGSAPRFAVAMFDSDALEKRIRNLLTDRPRIGKPWLLGVALTILAAASLAAATQAIRVATPADFAGHWAADFQGHPFFSMQLDRDGKGTINDFGIRVDSFGELESGEPRPGVARITDSRVEGSTLHLASEERVTTSDGGDRVQHLKLDFTITGANRGEIKIPGSRVKPWTVERR